MKFLTSINSTSIVSVFERVIFSFVLLLMFLIPVFDSLAKKKGEVTGPGKACAGTEQEYSANFKRCSRILWVVNGDAGIIHAAGINLKEIRDKFAIEAQDQLCYLKARRRVVKLRFRSPDGKLSQLFEVRKKMGLFNGKNKAISVTVAFDSAGASTIQWSGKMGWSGIRGRKSALKAVSVLEDISGNFFSLYLYGVQPDSIKWGESIILSTDSVSGASYQWDISPDNVIVAGGGNNSTLEISGFSKPGMYSASVSVSDACGNTFNLNQNLKVHQAGYGFSIDTGFGTGTAGPIESFTPTCSEANAGFTIKLLAELSKDTQYEWILPPGWGSDIVPSFVEMVDGKSYCHYKGANLSSLLIKEESQAAESGIINLKLLFGGTTVTESLVLNAPQRIVVSLPAYLASCNDSVSIAGSVYHGTEPYSISWTKTNLEGNFKNLFNNSDSSFISAVFKSTSISKGYIKLFVSDSNGCYDSDSTLVAIAGAIFSDDESGWMSGNVNPPSDGAVVSNTADLAGSNRLYFIQSVNGEKKLKFYDWNGSSFSLNDAELVIPFSGMNVLRLVDLGSDHLVFFRNDKAELSVAPLSVTSGKNVVEHNRSFPSIIPGNFIVDPATSGLLKIYWTDMFGNLISQVWQFNSASHSFAEVTGLDTISSASSHLFNDLVKEELKIINNKLFYFKSDGGFYYRKLNDLSFEYRLNGTTGSSYVGAFSSIDYDSDGNVYFCAGGDIWYASFDSSDVLHEILQIDMPVNCNGHFAINRTSNVIYYTGTDNNIYQIYREADFSASGTIGIVKATSYGTSDFALGNLILKDPYLFYNSNTSEVYYLYYPILEDGEACYPKHARVKPFDIDFLRKDESVFVQIQKNEDNIEPEYAYHVYPNPFSEKVSLSEAFQNPGYVELINASGVVVLKKEFERLPFEFDVREVKPGVYYCKILSSGKDPVLIKVIKQ